MIDQIALIFEGRTDRLIKNLKNKMETAAEELRFEEAAQLRDRITALERITVRQNVVSERGGDQDIFGLALDESGVICVQVFFVRDGRLIGREKFILEQ